QDFAFDRLRSKNLIVFLESKALTPRFLQSGLEPDFFLMLFPEKCTSNGFQNFVYRAFLAGYPLERLVKPEFVPIVQEMTARFDEYFEPWRPERGLHKRYRWRPNVHLKDSPYDFLARLPSM